MARDLAQFGVRVFTIAPGLFCTPLMGELPADVQESLGRDDPVPASAWASPTSSPRWRCTSSTTHSTAK